MQLTIEKWKNEKNKSVMPFYKTFHCILYDICLSVRTRFLGILIDLKPMFILKALIILHEKALTMQKIHGVLVKN